DRVLVVDGAGATHGPKLVDLRLHIARAVDRTALQHGGLAVPHPVDVEAGQRLRQDRPLQARGAPVAAAIDAHIDALDGAPARPGQTGDVVVALVQQHLATRGRGDHALALLDTGVLAVRTIGHVVDVVHGFVLGGPLLVAHLDTTQVLDPAHALHARHHQAQRVTVLGAQHL